MTEVEGEKRGETRVKRGDHRERSEFEICNADGEEKAYLWLGRFTGLGAVTLPKETIRRCLQK